MRLTSELARSTKDLREIQSTLEEQEIVLQGLEEENKQLRNRLAGISADMYMDGEGYGAVLDSSWSNLTAVSEKLAEYMSPDVSRTASFFR